MIYGVEQSTDQRYPQTRIHRFRSRAAAERWRAGGGGYTCADPEAACNWHHVYRDLYELPAGWRPPSRGELSRRAFVASTATYPRCAADMLAVAIENAGERIERRDA